MSSQIESVKKPDNEPVVSYPALPIHQTIIACVLAYLIPGLGHIYLTRWQRGLAFFASIYGMFLLGIIMKGHLYGLDINFATEKLSILLAFANAGTGLVYWVLHLLHSVSNISIGFGLPQAEVPTYEYANTFLWTAGLLNYLVAMDAYDIAVGRKK